MVRIILLYPLIAALVCLILGVLAIVRGSVKVGGGRRRVTEVTRAEHPVRFWIHVSMFGAAAILFTIMGLAFLRV